MLSRDTPRARAFGVKVGVAEEAPCTSDFDEFASAIDAAYIATPHTDHCQDALRCLRAGLHVLVEKPMALTAEDGEFGSYALFLTVSLTDDHIAGEQPRPFSPRQRRGSFLPWYTSFSHSQMPFR